MKAVKGKDGHIYLQPESEKQMDWAMKEFKGRERLAKLTVVGNPDDGFQVQVRLKPE